MDGMLNMLGLCARAGRLVTGEKACVQAIRSGGAFAAVLDGAAAKNAEKAISQACRTYGVPLLRTGSFELGDAIGKPSRMAAVVTDRRMAQRVVQLCPGPDRPTGGHAAEIGRDAANED